MSIWEQIPPLSTRFRITVEPGKMVWFGGFSQVLISSIASNGSGGWHIALEDGNWRAHLRTEGTDLAIGHPLPQSKSGPGQWTHLAMTISQSPTQTDIEFFINGLPIQADSTQEPMTITGSEHMILGNQQDHLTSARQYGGEISDVRISSGKRYTSIFQPPLHFNADNDTVALWTFDEGSGQTLFDQSGNGFDGTLLGATWTNACPSEDIDQDGLLAWEDCDDTNASIWKETAFIEPNSGHPFWACNAETTWQDAESACLGRGRHLTFIETDSINTWLGQEMTAHFPSPSAGWWICLND